MKTKRSLRIPNDTTCVILKLTYELACYRCETSIAQGINRDILKCNKPWEHKWGNHRLMKYVHKYHAVRNFLSLPNEGDEIVDDEEKISYSHIRRNVNIDVIHDEITERNITHDNTITWRELLTLLKTAEGNTKYFYPCLPIEQYTLSVPRQRWPT